jgi:hypothetical protein
MPEAVKKLKKEKTSLSNKGGSFEERRRSLMRKKNSAKLIAEKARSYFEQGFN